jgi:hypothetical protein
VSAERAWKRATCRGRPVAVRMTVATRVINRRWCC